MKKTIYSDNGQNHCRNTHPSPDGRPVHRDLAKKLKRERSFVAHCELGEQIVDLAEFYWICKACGASPSKEASKLMNAFAEQAK
ncbi:hypothetical protein [Pontiella sp.]|uniref:hypothetical protein n=1 Tax=Pontiella sp. TaxID=2837462 RepID=UPI0035612D89